MKFNKLLVCGLLILSSAAHADSEEVYNYRAGVMKSVGGQMSSIVAIMKGKVFSENLGTHIAALAQMAEIVPTVFPEGSGFNKSEALPKIWEQPADFKKRMDDFVDAAKKLGAVGPAGDMAAIGPAVQALGKTCKGCHDDFRKKDE